jgi:gliding motility-associated-like protein
VDSIRFNANCGLEPFSSIVTLNLLISDVAAEWKLSDPQCPDDFVSRLQIDTITHQAPHYLVRDGLDSISISSLPVEITDLPSGEHEIQFVSADSCKSPVSTIQIEELILPEIQLVGPPEVDICDPPTLFQVETNISGSVQWYSNSSLQCDTCRSTEAFSFQQGPIGVEFTADNNCTTTAEIDLTVSGLDAQYFVPNVFSPNGDGINDYFTLFGKQGAADQIERLEIYDRWGNKLFEGKDITPSVESEGWNGWSRGQPVSTGVYAYRIVYQYCDGSRYRLHGTVTLVK